MQLSNPAIDQLFSISEATWTALNTHVGILKYINVRANTPNGAFYTAWPDGNTLQYLNNLAAGSSPSSDKLLIPVQAQDVQGGVVIAHTNWYIVPGIPNLWSSCDEWMSHTFTSLIILNNQIQMYASTASNSFGNILTMINAGGGTVSAELQSATTTAITNLAQSTQSFVSNATNIFNSLQTFLTANQNFAGFLNNNGTLLNIIALPQLQSSAFQTFITATEQVLGAWSALESELNAAISAPITVTLPFLESLNLQVAINDWNAVSAASQNFMAFAQKQTNYWFYTPA
ncbi:MAG: hypothetical protein IT236_00180 [Bacteroidia bacterium]|nr:hypothetical protein [Bacteroidia bacterium]